jgi:parallel beta-helix repeat protein
MKLKLIIIFVSMLLVAGFFPVSGVLIIEKTPSTMVNGNILYVGGDGPGNYSTIKDAIQNATDGDTVFVYSGTYVIDDFILIDVSIRLIGENKEITVISGMAMGINKTGVEIREFTFLNQFGIIASPLFEEFDNFILSDNIFKVSESFQGFGGVFIFSNYSTISNNTFSNCGIWLLSYHNTVYNNTVNGKPLVYFEEASDKVIEDAGQLILIDCNNITIENLELSNTLFGLQLVDTDNCLIVNNDFSNNDMTGILLFSNNNIIHYNTFSNNMVGFIFGDCEGNDISTNSFENNQFSLFFLMSSGNFIQNNNFKYSYPTLNKNILSTKSKNTWNGNYWDRGRLLPVLIWNFEIINLRRLRIIPSSPDIDWRPARRLNDIDSFNNHRSAPINTNSEKRMLTILSLLNVLEQFPIIQKLFSF